MKRLEHGIKALQRSNGPSNAAPQRLWSVGMTGYKTGAIMTKLQRIYAESWAFNNDPVYGLFIAQHLSILTDDIDAAFLKYSEVMQAKYDSDPVFREKWIALESDFNPLGLELQDQTGWTFEDNDGTLEEAAASW